jgi:hypothetical protein
MAPLTEEVLNQDAITDELPDMIPVSNPPLLLLQSSSPIISREECMMLSQYFEERETKLDPLVALSDEHNEAQAISILHRVREVIDKVTNCPSHDGEMQIPRFLRYDPRSTSPEKLTSPEFANVLLPDGLHVDTNNGKLFRHITAILYLTDNEDGPLCDGQQLYDGKPVESNTILVGGGTTFPLAVPFGSSDSPSVSSYDVSINLLSKVIHHTKANSNEEEDSDQRHLVQLAMDSFYRDISKCCNALESSKDHHTTGVRVMPQAGKLIYFHNIGDDGRPDPTSFHGGEEITIICNKDTPHLKGNFYKSILVFFKEIPVEKIQDLGSFAYEVQAAREWTTKRYFS